MDALGLGPYLAGVAMLCVTLGVPAFAAHVAQQRWAPNLPQLTAFLAMMLFWTLGVIVEHLVPLALGVLSRGTVLLAAAALGVAAGVLWLGGRPADHRAG